MPLLNCTARTCLYNVDEYCSKGDIKVDGRTATKADETCCQSFQERKDSAANSCRCGSETIHVDCSACHCAFNTHEKCKADKITITGAAACHKDETTCGSFRAK